MTWSGQSSENSARRTVAVSAIHGPNAWIMLSS